VNAEWCTYQQCQGQQERIMMINFNIGTKQIPTGKEKDEVPNSV
jgi:hypothetical protein